MPNERRFYRNARSSFKAEAALCVHTFTSVLIFVVMKDFLMSKLCSVNLGYSSKVCEALGSRDGSSTEYHTEKIQIQKYIGRIMIARTVLENLFPTFLVILIGAWSDKYGRKLPMLFVVGGYIIQNVFLSFCVYFKTSLGGWAVTIATSLIPSLSGNNASFNMAVHSYVAENVAPEKQTERTGFVHSVLFFGVTVGLVIGGAISKSDVGFGNIFLIGSVLEIGVFIYICRTIKDNQNQPLSTGKTLLEIFNTQHMKDSVRVVCKPRAGNTRTKLCVLLAIYFIALAPIVGEGSAFYLYTNYKYNWSSAQLGFFLTYKSIFRFGGNFITTGILTKKLKLSDPVIGISGGISTLLASLYLANVNNSNLLFLGPVLSMLSESSLVVARSMLYKIIPTEDLGKVNSFLGFIDSIAPLITCPLYSIVYAKTFEVNPGAFFLVSGFTTVLHLIGYMYFLSLSDLKHSKKN